MGAVFYFLCVTGYLAHYGDGVMTTRYSNLMLSGDESLVSVVKCVLLSPMKAIYECATVDKLKFIAKTLLPLLALPLLTRRYEHYLLLIPYILINLLSDYCYQYDLFYQYNFGTMAFLLYLSMIVLAEFRSDRRRITTLVASVAITAVLFCYIPMSKGVSHSLYYLQNRETCKQIDQVLETVPTDASVCCSSRFSSHLASRTILYDAKDCSVEHLLSCEYVIIDISKSPEDELIKHLLDNGYMEIRRLDGQLIIYQHSFT